MRDILLATATMLVLTGGVARAASTNDEIFANAALRELHNLAAASAQSERAAKDSDGIGCRDAYDGMQKAAHEALTSMHQMSFAPTDALNRVSSLLRLSNLAPNGCLDEDVMKMAAPTMIAGQAVIALRTDYSIGDAEWYMVNPSGDVEAKNPLRYAQSLNNKSYSWVDVGPKGITFLVVTDWKAEMASYEVGDPSIENSGNNLKIVEVDYRKNSGDDNTSVYFYRTNEDAQANDALFAANQTADWYYMDGNEDGGECHAMSGTPKQFADAAVGRGATHLETRGRTFNRADVVVSYDRKDSSYSYYFYKSHEKCANPFDAADNTRSDFSRIRHNVDADQDKADQTLADEALKHATDKGPWWVSDGGKIWSGCKLAKFTPMGDALSAKAKGARDIEITGGLRAANVSHPIDVVVKYDLNGKSFYNDYYTNKFCDDSDPPSQTDRAKAVSVSSRSGESWYVDYYSDKMQCVETKRTPKELGDEAKGHDATDVEFAVPSSDKEKTFLYLQYGVGDQGHMIGFSKTLDACTDAIATSPVDAAAPPSPQAAATAPNSEAAPTAPPSGSWASRPDVTPADKEGVLERARWEISLGRPREPIIERLRQLGLNPAGAAPPSSQAAATGGVCDTLEAVRGPVIDALKGKLALEVTGVRGIRELPPNECLIEATTSGQPVQFRYSRDGDNVQLWSVKP